MTDVAVLVLSQYIEAQFATPPVREFGGGIGYLLRTACHPAALVAVVERVVARECVVDPSLVAELLTGAVRDGPEADRRLGPDRLPVGWRRPDRA